jgi:energy-dependent translational throttle protein EttA
VEAIFNRFNYVPSASPYVPSARPLSLDVDTLRALEQALENFAGSVAVISHDRWFLDRIATHILAFEGESTIVWFEGNYSEYEADRRGRLGAAADQPHRIKYRQLTRN